MNENKCIYCGKVISDKQKVCASCERELMKLGMIMQSRQATEEEVETAYKMMEARNDD